MDFSVKVNCFFIFILCSLVSCKAKDWLCPVEPSNKSVHEYFCRTTNNTIDGNFEDKSCHSITDDFNLPTNNSEVTELKIKHCGLYLIASYLKSYENVISLDISNSGYDSLESFDLNHKFLKKLNASHNNLTEIPRDFFVNIPEVIVVDLSHNNLEIIDSTFESAVKLSAIHLSHNNINTILNETFAHLKDLEYVDLSNNKIDGKLHDYNDFFNENTKLKVVHLESNRFEQFVPDIPFATSVYISWRRYSRINVRGFAKRFRIIPNSADEGYFRTSSECTEFRCNEHSFVNVYTLSIGRDQIENVHDLFGCFGSSSKLKSLDLSGNVVSNVSSSEMSRFKHLQDLKLSGAHLKSLDILELKHQTNLKLLDISNNGLKTLENVHLLSTFKSLEYFSMEINELDIPEIINSLSSSIKVLSLSVNFVGDISRINFAKFEDLLMIGLGRTSLQFADVNPFEQNRRLTFLDISYNNLANQNLSIMANSIYKLTEFYAAGCQIEDAVEVIKLLGPNLERVDLSDNYLTTLNITTVMNYVQFIDVQGNNLTELIDFDKSKLPQLASLKIAYNNFACEYLVRFLDRIKIEWPNLEMIGDPYKQKHGEDCHSNVEKVTEISPKWFYSVEFVVPSVVLLLIFFAVIGFVFYRQFSKETTVNEYEEPPEAFQMESMEATPTTLDSPAIETPYEEIVAPTADAPIVDDQYDRLDFIGQARTINSSADGYETVNLSIQ